MLDDRARADGPRRDYPTCQDRYSAARPFALTTGRRGLLAGAAPLRAGAVRAALANAGRSSSAPSRCCSRTTQNTIGNSTRATPRNNCATTIATAHAASRALIEALRAGGIDGQTVLDVGGGVGAVHHALLRSGAASAVDVDASRAYVATARAEAERQGHADRVRYLTGDFVALADDVGPADLVALDRVICCYPDMAALVGRSAALARRRYGPRLPA